MNPWEKLTEEDIRNIKYGGTGCWQFLLTVIASVIATLGFLDSFGFLEIWK
jgi:hypothetical protein